VIGRSPEEKRRRHRERVQRGLDAALADPKTPERDFDLEHDRLVVFSDHHRGARDGADDFWRCERSYHAALGHYLVSGHRLFLLGDVEELWKNGPSEPVAKYADTLELEAEFFAQGRLERFWGNHDDAWRHEDEVEKHFHDRFGGLVCHEALVLHVVSEGQRLGKLFFVHGHQGTLDSDRFSFASRWFVRYGWRPLQRRFTLYSTTPSRDFELRAAHDQAMFAWARERAENLVLIAGHTHRPVFGGTTPPPPRHRKLDVIERELAEAEAAPEPDRVAIAQLRAEYELVKTAPFGDPPVEIWPPCYYNAGCCSFGDGDVTGLEIADGKIRLFRWLNDDYQPVAKLLAEEDLRAVLDAVEHGGPSPFGQS
jgi:hypothetical protein